MLQGFVVGTLAAINTAMLPIGGLGDQPAHIYRLESPACGDRMAGAIKVAATDSSLQVLLQTEPCANGHKPASVALALPEDLLDEAYLDKLPVNSSFVAMNVPSSKNPLLKVRVKLTKEKALSGATLIALEWLPATEGAEPERSPVKIWLKDKVTVDGELAWSKIEIADLGTRDEFQVSTEIMPKAPAHRVR